MRYVFGRRSRVYHDTWHLGERCNTDALQERRESDTPPEGKHLCSFCRRQAAKETGVSVSEIPR